MKRILLHVCCGPCSLGVIPSLSDLLVSGYYYNPNIYPEIEYERRLQSAQKVFKEFKKDLIIPSQSRNDFFNFIVEEKKKPFRCSLCCYQRLEKTAEFAKSHGFDFFSTTLLVSPYQYHQELIRIGQEVQEKYQILFYYKDFRDHFTQSIKSAENRDLYLQKYCGCKYSRKRK